MDKLKMHSPDLTQDNIAKVRELFPACVTEAIGADGKVKLSVDFDQLRQELSESIAEGPQERYHLNWPGKREALITANSPIAKTLRPARTESIDFDTTGNLFIEGDNLEALKLLQETYLGRIKMIYIDPPYNTGNDFVYDDDFGDSTADFLMKSNQVGVGGKLVSNPSSNGRYHSDWLSFMYPRLRRARDFLTEDGAILISIDDIEVKNVRNLCDEIFGSDNFVCSFIWKSRQIIDSRNKTNSSADHEYIVMYAKKIDMFALRGKEIDENKYSNPDNDPRGPWMSNSILGLATASQRPNLHYELVDPKTNRVFPCAPDSGWRYSRETMAEKIAEGRIIFPTKDDGRPREKKFQSELNSAFTGISSVLPEAVGFTLNGSRELRDLMDGKFFDFPKPTSLLKLLIMQVAYGSNDIVMDFFSGSGTTGHSVMLANADDGASRKFILVQIPQPLDEKSDAYAADFRTIADISKERLRRAGKLVSGGKSGLPSCDTGFRVLKIDTSNMADVYYTPDATNQGDLLAQVDSIKQGRKSEDLLFQVLVDWGVDLTLPIRRETVQGKTVFFVDENALVACFDTGVTEELVKELAGHEPVRVVFRDTGFVSDAVKINVEQIFRQLSPSTEVKAI